MFLVSFILSNTKPLQIINSFIKFIHSLISYASSTGKILADEDGLPILVWERPCGDIDASPFWYVHLPAGVADAVLESIAARSMLLKCVVELWGEGSTWEEVQSEVRQYDPVERAQYSAEDQSFKFVVETWGRTATMEQKIDIIESFEECTKFLGPIDLKAPMHYWYAIECAVTNYRSCLPKVPIRYYFGRQIASSVTQAGRQRLPVYDLKKRRYLGPTSMDPELSFIMCALGGVRKSSLVFDPFIGTGSVMITAADLGAYTLGMDIDVRVIKYGKVDKKGNSVNIWTNFADYGLPPPLGLIRGDLHRSPFRNNLEGVLDAIVADPPYGVRAGARKSNSKPDIVINDRSWHIPSTAPYCLAECLRDLVECSARWLAVGGKLVYWIPAAQGYYFEDELPKHPAMEMQANCEQVLASRYSRRLIVMRKVRAYDAVAAAEYYEKVGPPKMAIDELRDYVYATEDENGNKIEIDRRPRFRNKSV